MGLFESNCARGCEGGDCCGAVAQPCPHVGTAGVRGLVPGVAVEVGGLDHAAEHAHWCGHAFTPLRMSRRLPAPSDLNHTYSAPASSGAVSGVVG